MWVHKHHEEIEKLICSKCPADINKDYSPCKNCKRGDDFELGYEAGLHADVHTDNSAVITELEKENAELKSQIDEMKKELHHRLVNPSKSDSDCLDKIIGLDRLWQFGKEF